MAAKWGSCISLIVALAMLSGCRTPQPVLKPVATAEQLVAPPLEARYETAGYPKVAFAALEDPNKRWTDSKTGGVPGRGSMAGTGGMGGMGGRGYP